MKTSRACALLVVTTALGPAVAACSDGDTDRQPAVADSSATTRTPVATSSPEEVTDQPEADGVGPVADAALPEAHVHGVGVDPADGTVYVAAHDGLYHYGPDGTERVGPQIDLMGFAVVGPRHLVASGHPGPGTELPDPVGLIESRDGGRTWTSLSRAGESDFHALSASPGRVVGFDGQLRVSADGAQWTSAELGTPLADVAVSPDGDHLMVTTQEGVQRSDDGGATWQLLDTAPVLVLVSAAGPDGWVGLTPEGRIAVSTDDASTWEVRAEVGTDIQAFTGVASGTGDPEVLVVTGTGILHSADGGRSVAGLGD